MNGQQGWQPYSELYSFYRHSTSGVSNQQPNHATTRNNSLQPSSLQPQPINHPHSHSSNYSHQSHLNSHLSSGTNHASSYPHSQSQTQPQPVFQSPSPSYSHAHAHQTQSTSSGTPSSNLNLNLGRSSSGNSGPLNYSAYSSSYAAPSSTSGNASSSWDRPQAPGNATSLAHSYGYSSSSSSSSSPSSLSQPTGPSYGNGYPSHSYSSSHLEASAQPAQSRAHSTLSQAFEPRPFRGGLERTQLDFNSPSSATANFGAGQGQSWSHGSFQNNKDPYDRSASIGSQADFYSRLSSSNQGNSIDQNAAPQRIGNGASNDRNDLTQQQPSSMTPTVAPRAPTIQPQPSTSSVPKPSRSSSQLNPVGIQRSSSSSSNSLDAAWTPPIRHKPNPVLSKPIASSSSASSSPSSSSNPAPSQPSGNDSQPPYQYGNLYNSGLNLPPINSSSSNHNASSSNPSPYLHNSVAAPPPLAESRTSYQTSSSQLGPTHVYRQPSGQDQAPSHWDRSHFPNHLANSHLQSIKPQIALPSHSLTQKFPHEVGVGAAAADDSPSLVERILPASAPSPSLQPRRQEPASAPATTTYSDQNQQGESQIPGGYSTPASLLRAGLGNPRPPTTLASNEYSLSVAPSASRSSPVATAAIPMSSTTLARSGSDVTSPVSMGKTAPKKRKSKKQMLEQSQAGSQDQAQDRTEATGSLPQVRRKTTKPSPTKAKAGKAGKSENSMGNAQSNQVGNNSVPVPLVSDRPTAPFQTQGSAPIETFMPSDSMDFIATPPRRETDVDDPPSPPSNPFATSGPPEPRKDISSIDSNSISSYLAMRHRDPSSNHALTPFSAPTDQIFSISPNLLMRNPPQSALAQGPRAHQDSGSRAEPAASPYDRGQNTSTMMQNTPPSSSQGTHEQSRSVFNDFGTSFLSATQAFTGLHPSGPMGTLESPDPLNIISPAGGQAGVGFHQDTGPMGSPLSSKRKAQVLSNIDPRDLSLIPPSSPRMGPDFGSERKSKHKEKGKDNKKGLGTANFEVNVQLKGQGKGEGEKPKKKRQKKVDSKAEPARTLEIKVPPPRSAGSLVEVIIPSASRSSQSQIQTMEQELSRLNAEQKPPSDNSSTNAYASTKASTPRSGEVYVQIPALGFGSSNFPPTPPKAIKEDAGFRKGSDVDMIVDSDPDADAEGSDWDDIDLLNTWGAPYYSTFTTPGRSRVSAGPVKASDRRVPMAKLLGFIEDIFEADDSLPDRDTMAEMQPGEVFSGPAETFFELMDLGSGSSYGMPLLKSSVLHKLLRLVLQCSRPLADMAKMKVTESSKKNVDLASIPQQELGRLLRILERTVKISGSIDPFPNNVRGSKSLTSSPTKPKKKTSVAVVASPERSPGICTPEVEDVAEEKGHDGLEDEDTATPAPAQNGSDAESFDELGTKMQILIRSLLAAECCFAILSGDQLAKPLLSEDLIRSCFDIVKVSLEKTLLPFVEACSGLAVTATHPILASLIQFLGPQKGKKQKLPIDPSTAAAVNSCLDLLAKLFRHTCSALSLVQRLVRLPSLAMSDSIVISAVYLAIGPFFVSEPEPSTSNSNSDAAKASAKGRAALTALGGANTMKTLRLPALNLLRNVFAKHAEQRQWMIEEILTSLTKVTDMKKNRRQYGLRNGKAIHSITALLMQLVQAATHGVQERGRAKRSKGERERADVIDEDEDDQEEKSEADLETLLNGPELDLVALRASMDGAAQSAKAIAVYLMQRVGQIKVTKSSQEMNYASIVENLIEDLLNALYLPDWPAAALLLSCFCRIFASYLEDPKSSPDSKGVALDHLGTVAARLRQSELSLAESPLPETGVEAEDRSARSENEMEEKGPEASNLQRLLLPWITATKNEKCLYEVKNTYAQVLSFLAEAGGDDQAAESAIEFLIAQVQYELSGALTKAKSDVNQALDEKAAALELVKMHEFVGSIEEVINSFNDWRPSDSDVFGASSEEDFKRAYRTAELVSQSCSLMVSYQFLRQQLLGALDGQAVGNRTKALRGLGSISVVDPDLLDEPEVRSAVEVRLSDQSIGVRETAVGLLGKYVLRKTEYIEAYYDHLAGRIHDAGLAVRKRALRLLKNIYFASRSRRITVDACVRIVRCIYDEDTTVQDLAIVTIGEMWLSLPTGGSEARNVKRKESPSPASLDLVGSATGFVADEDVDMPSGSEVQLSDKVAIIMAVAAQIRERPSPLEEVFRRLMKDRKDSEATELLEKLRVLTDSLIDDLVDATDASPAETVTRIKTVHLLVTTNPSILSITKAKLLLPYLKSAQTIEELQMMELLLKIFRACLPWMPKTASTFAESLEKSMTPLVSKPPVKPGSQVLQELIACYCTVIKTMTHNFTLLSRTLKACLGRLLQIRNKTASSKNFELDRPSSLIMSLTALLCEHGDFDEIRSKYPDAVKDINAISQRPIVDVVSETFLAIYKNSRSTVRSFALQNLGYLFRAHPTLMTRPAVVEIMDEIFATGSVQDRTSLLKIILEFLNSDAARRDPEGLRNVNAKKATPTAGKDKVDMSELVGNTESFAETGVGSAMMQRYADPVLKATLEIENTSLQRTASDILKFTVLQGLSHPIQCVPYLVALETTNDPHIRSRALHLHSHLSSKHASLVAARYLDCAKASFTFQLQLTKSPELLRGYHEDLQPTAKLHAWYTLLRDKRQSRLDFVKTIVKALDVNTAASECSQESILFARYIADNLATLDYKTLEELFVVIGDLRSILAVSGMQVLFMVQNAIGHKPLGQEVAPQPEGAADEPGTPPRPGEVNPIPTPAPTLHPLSDTEGCNIEEAESTKGVEVVKLTEMTDGQDGNGGEGQPLSEKEVEAKTYNLARMSIVMGTALILRNHLKWLYNLSEQKCAKFVPGKKQSAGADRPAVQRNVADPSMAALSFDEMPWGIIKMDSLEDAKTQMELFVRMVEDEGTMLEPDDPEVMMMMDG